MGAYRKSSSRSAKLQQQHERKLMLQILAWIFCGVLILTSLAVWGIPAFVSVSDTWLNSRPQDTQSATNTSTIRPPSLSRFTNDLTNNDTVDVSAFSTAGATVVLERNGAQVGENTADGAGSVMFAGVSLIEGRNEFRAFVVEREGQRSEGSNAVSITRDTQIPTIVVDTPFSGESFKGLVQRTVNVTGKANESELVYVNDIRVIMSTDGSFSQQYPLEPGENTITVYAVDEAGNESVKVVRVVRWEE